MHRSAKTIVMLLLCFFFSINLVQTVNAEDSKITISLEEGLNGKIKSGKGFPLTIKIENNGESFSGDLLISFLPSYNTGGATAINVELPANSTKTYHISLPGLSEDNPSIHQNESMLHLYKGDWKKGKSVKFKGENMIKPKYIDMNEKVIGVLSENYDRLKELRILPSTSIQMLELKKEQIPQQSIGLEMFDYLLIDEYAVSQLDKGQQEAMKEWIEKGGVLIAGGSPDGSQSYGLLYSLLPMKMDKEISAKTDFLQGKNNEKPTFSDLTLFSGEVEESEAVLDKTGSVPATLKKQYGNGIILQTGFSLGDEPLASWKGYSTWFAKFINEADTSNTYTGKNRPDFYGQMYYEFVETNELFSASNFSLGQLIGILVGYIIIIVPLLYFILRKLDKREHSWWIIPSIAFVMAVVVFGIGAKGRISQPQLNQMGVYKYKDSHLTGLQASTLLSNKSGEYTLSFQKDQYNAVTSTGNNGNPSIDPIKSAVFEEKRKQTNIIFPDVGYWSSKTIFGQANQKIEGGFINDLSLKNNRITGTIENGYDYDFEEIYIWSGNEKINLGSLKKGEQIKVDKETKVSLLTKPTTIGYPSSFNQRTDINKMKKERLEYVASNYLLSAEGSESEPIVAGFTKDSIIDVKMPGKKEKQLNLNLILEPVKVKNEIAGPFTLKNDMLSTKLNVITGHIFNDYMNGTNREVALDRGEYEYRIKLPMQLIEKSHKLDEISISFNNQMAEYSIFNQETGEYLAINHDQRNVKLDSSNNIQQYVSKEGEILLKLLKNANSDQNVQLPKITIKGEVTP